MGTNIFRSALRTHSMDNDASVKAVGPQGPQCHRVLRHQATLRALTYIAFGGTRGAGGT